MQPIRAAGGREMKRKKKLSQTQYLSIKAIVAEVGGSESFWRRLCWSRKLTYVKLGRRVAVPRRSLRRFLRVRTKKGS